MRLLYRILIILFLIIFIKTFIFPKPQVFISWSKGFSWECIEWQLAKWREQAQDLPASIKMGIRQLLNNYVANEPRQSV